MSWKELRFVKANGSRFDVGKQIGLQRGTAKVAGNAENLKFVKN